MFTPIHGHGSSFDALSIAFRHAAEAEARQDRRDGAETTGEASRRPGQAVVEIALHTRPTHARTRRSVRVGAALASLVISVSLIGSVLLGFDMQASSASEMALAAPAAHSVSGRG